LSYSSLLKLDELKYKIRGIHVNSVYFRFSTGRIQNNTAAAGMANVNGGSGGSLSYLCHYGNNSRHDDFSETRAGSAMVNNESDPPTPPRQTTTR
jgi:hypothetical protein